MKPTGFRHHASRTGSVESIPRLESPWITHPIIGGFRVKDGLDLYDCKVRQPSVRAYLFTQTLQTITNFLFALFLQCCAAAAGSLGTSGTNSGCCCSYVATGASSEAVRRSSCRDLQRQMRHCRPVAPNKVLRRLVPCRRVFITLGGTRVIHRHVAAIVKGIWKGQVFKRAIAIQNHAIGIHRDTVPHFRASARQCGKVGFDDPGLQSAHLQPHLQSWRKHHAKPGEGWFQAGLQWNARQPVQQRLPGPKMFKGTICTNGVCAWLVGSVTARLTTTGRG